MTILEAVLQGIIQGLTEFLPVSSSGHLSIFQYFTGLSGEEAALFSIMLHLGTLFAVVIAFFPTIWELVLEAFSMLGDILRGRFTLRNMTPYRRMVVMLFVSLLPLVFVVVLKDFYESFSTDNDIIVEGICLIITGILLALACRCPEKGKKAATMQYGDAVAIGIAQAVAPMPGISRSGSTIATGMLMGLGKKFAVTFSFIMGIPAVLGLSLIHILYGFGEIRTPMFEHTELFVRSVGDTTDVVQKEMYTFEDKKGRSITLKPEGTAGAVRAAIENGLLADALPLKLSYVTPCFRYEKQQAGRYRQFHQFGVELLGAKSSAADAEVIGLVAHCLKTLGVEQVRLLINSIGCPNCRPKYQQALKEYFHSHEQELCATCKDRLERNPMRILDCKEQRCKEIAKQAPVVLDFLCQECSEHFEELKARLAAMGVAFDIDPQIVRGLDYYTKTVFEFKTDAIGAQGTICGGGRYDGLVEMLGAQPQPAVGFAIGLERLKLVMEACGAPMPEQEPCTLYLVPLGEAASVQCSALAEHLRQEGLAVQSDIMSRSLKAQMKYANKAGARYTMVVGDAELQQQCARLKDMETGQEQEVAFAQLGDTLMALEADRMYQNIAQGSFGLEALMQ